MRKQFNLYDVVNLVHPKSTPAIHKFMNDEIGAIGTWEAELSKAGQIATTDEEKAELKREAWAELIHSRKIGYFALLRNLRNIMEQAPEVLDEALELLVDEKLIRKSLVLPFRYLTAYDEIGASGLAGKQKVLTALSKAIDVSVNNVPEFKGNTLIALDVSSSMSGGYGHRGSDNKAPARLGAVLMGAMLKKNPDNTDLMVFEGIAKYLNIDAGDTTLSIVNQIVKHIHGGYTNTPDVFNKATKKYDRVVIISDMQTWVENNYSHYYGGSTSSVPVAKDAYAKKFGVNPHIYTLDMSGYGTANFSDNQVYQLAGFSEKIFDLMSLLEKDRNAMVNEIENSVTF